MPLPDFQHILEGEILGVQKRRQGENDSVLKYQCRVFTRHGRDIVVGNVRMASFLGGISDYYRRRCRSSDDKGSSPPPDFTQEKLDATIGERVFIAFIGGNALHPVIIGFADHPNQINEPSVESSESTTPDPAAVMQLLGIRVEINSDGDIKFLHKGAPKQVNYVPQDGLAILPDQQTQISGESPPIGGEGSPAVPKTEPDNAVLWEMLKNGIYRVRDSEGQIIELDRTKKRVYISNNDLKSTQNPGGIGVIGNEFASNSTDAEYLMLDKEKQLAIINARKIAQIYSFDRRKDVTEGNHSHKVGGNSEWKIGGNEIVKISGSQETSADSIRYVAGDTIELHSGKLPIPNMTIKISPSGIGIGNKSAELIDIVSKTLDALGRTMGNLGYPLSTSADFIQLKLLLEQIKGGI